MSVLENLKNSSGVKRCTFDKHIYLSITEYNVSTKFEGHWLRNIFLEEKHLHTGCPKNRHTPQIFYYCLNMK